MKARCYNPGHPDFPAYGGSGVRVCARWRDSFQAFVEDMGERPPGMTLDRYPDPDGDYEPGNCRWATHQEQMLNRRRRPVLPKRAHGAAPSVDAANLIDDLGGALSVATIVFQYLGYELKPQAVSNWKRRGIPYRYRACLAIEARERGIGVPAGFLGEGLSPDQAAAPETVSAKPAA